MGVLKRKDEKTATVTVRVPASVKAEIDRLRGETDTAGFDLNATMSEAVVRVTKQMREELTRLNGRNGGRDRGVKTAGLADGNGVA